MPKSADTNPLLGTPFRIPFDSIRAEQRWREYSGPRSFRAERAAFVRNTMGNHWEDLAEFSLGPVAVR